MVNLSAADLPRSVVELLSAMVRINTVSPAHGGVCCAEAPLTDWLEQLAARWGLSSRRLLVPGFGDNLLVSDVDLSARDRGWLLLESHLDTVGVAGMTIDPFGGEVRDGRMYGRGACDTKASGAAMLWALRRHAATTQRRTHVAVALTVDEEHRKSGAAALAERQLPALGLRPAGVVVGEPTGNHLISAHNGVTRWTITTFGRAAHSCNPELGQSAVSAMCRLVLELEDRYIPSLAASHPLTGRARCSINTIHGGTAINIIPEQCQCEVDRRVVPGEDGRAAIEAVDAVLRNLQQRMPTLRWSHGPAFVDPPLDPAVSGDFVARISAVLTWLGLDGQPRGVPYGTDASNFSGQGIPAVVLGPGDIAQAHTADEWIDLHQVEQATEVYLALMQSEWRHGDRQ